MNGGLPSTSETRRSYAVLAAMMASFAVFLWFYVPRLNNFVLSDREFTGWSGPIAERMAQGDRPYIDFVLPIPPGSMMVLGFIQRMAGRALLIQELWVAGISHLLMGVLAYAIAVAMTSRKNALFVAAATLVLVVQTPKEIAYDHTSLLCAWLSLATGTHALFGPSRARRSFLWAISGFLATLTLLFKQSTGVGIVAGWCLGIAYLLGALWRERDRPALDDARRGATRFAVGAVFGFVALWGGLVAARTNLPSFARAVFIDGPALKGGSWTLLKQLYGYVVHNDVLRNALVPIALLMALFVRLARQRRTMHIGDEPANASVLDGRTALAIGASASAVFGIAAALLAAEVRDLNHDFTVTVDTLRLIPGYGFVCAIVFFLAHLFKADPLTADPEQRRRGHAYNTFMLVALFSSLIYDTSFIHFSPFYYNTPEIPLALIFLFIALDRARLVVATWAVFAITLLPFFGVKLNRALSDDIPIRSGYWAGLRVNYRGEQVFRAAKRVQEIAAPNETVLVLPEDVELAGLIHRPRPPVKGAILFVDQYPRRLVDDDLKIIDKNLPKVIVIHPRRRTQWQVLYGTWSQNSAAQRVLEHVLDRVLPKHYRLDSSYPTTYFWDQGLLDVWVHDEDASRRTIPNESL